MFKRISSRVKKAWAAVALMSVEVVLVAGLFLIALTIFIIVVRRIFVLRQTAFDLAVFNLLGQHVSEDLNKVVLFFTFLGTHTFMIPANLSLIFYYLFIKKHKWYSIKIPAVALSSLALMAGLKHLFNRPRPSIPLLYEAKGLSFPSGHALTSVTFFGLLIYIVYKSNEKKGLKWTLIVLLLLLILVIGCTRIYLRVHYATDVIAGFAVGFIWLSFSLWMLGKLERKSSMKLDAVVQQEAPTNGLRT